MSFYRIGTPKRALAGVAIMLAIPAAAQESRVTPAGRQPVIIPCMGAAPPPEARCAPVEERLRVNERSRRIPQTIAPQEAFAPLPRDLVAQREASQALFPRGIDLVLVSGEAVVAIPRTTRQSSLA